MPSRGPDEGLEGGALRVDAQRNPFALLVLRDEAMDQFFALPDGQQAVLVAVAEGALGDGLEVAGVDTPTGDGVAALAHTGVVAQASLVQVRVGQRVAAGDPLGRVEDQHAAQQVNGLVGGAVRQHVEHRQRRRLVGPPQDVGPGPFTGRGQRGQRRRPQQVRDQVQLLDGALGLEQDPPAQQLGEDAAHRPDVDGRPVVPAAHQNLRRPVVLGHHLLGHVTRRVGLFHAGQAEVADLQQAVTVDQQIPRFDVPVEDPSRVEILQTWGGEEMLGGGGMLVG